MVHAWIVVSESKHAEKLLALYPKNSAPEFTPKSASSAKSTKSHLYAKLYHLIESNYDKLKYKLEVVEYNLKPEYELDAIAEKFMGSL